MKERYVLRNRNGFYAVIVLKPEIFNNDVNWKCIAYDNIGEYDDPELAKIRVVEMYGIEIDNIEYVNITNEGN